jgi:hypothetical protein
MTTPEAPSALPLQGAPPADRQSRIRGGRLMRHFMASGLPRGSVETSEVTS